MKDIFQNIKDHTELMSDIMRVCFKIQDAIVTEDNQKEFIECTKKIWQLRDFHLKAGNFTISELLENTFEDTWNKINLLSKDGFEDGMYHIIKQGM